MGLDGGGCDRCGETRRGRGGGGGEVDFGNGSGYRGWMLRERRLRDYRKEIMV